MENAIDLGVILRFLLRTLGIFALIFLTAVLTPKIARLIDRWVEKYRSNHDPAKDESYGVRSIYEFPPKRQETAEELDIPTEDLASADPDAPIGETFLPEEPELTGADEDEVPDEAPAEGEFGDEPDDADAFEDEFDEDDDEYEDDEFGGEVAAWAAPSAAHPSTLQETAAETPAEPAQQEASPWFMR